MTDLSASAPPARPAQRDPAAESCDLCSGAVRPWLSVPLDWRRPGARAAHRLVWCDGCDYGQLSPRPDRSAIAEFYDVKTYYTHIAEAARCAGAASSLDRLRIHLAWRCNRGAPIDAAWVRAISRGRPLRICDLGCGNGELLRSLLDDGHEGVGVEPDPAARAAAKESGIHALPGTAEDPPASIAPQAFDLVILRHVLEHCLEPQRALDNAISLLDSHGRLVIEVPNNAALGLEAAGPCWHWLDVPRHLNFFTERSLRRLCERGGLCITATEHAGYTRQFSREWIEVEQCIWDRFAQIGAAMPRPRNSRWRAWRLLARTLFARPRKKYDSVRVIASRVAE